MKTSTHGIKATSREVRIPMANGSSLHVNPKTNIVWVWHDGTVDGDLSVHHVNDLKEKVD
jgi:hypothetical protein